ncbi:uncharacterized protein LOC132583339 [Heteronotia binoei]|uniref:uncharacterized protein LOC132583339 n=1 Tax=Heteronotia binoei TaxID=13085 RepID=UPI00293076CA|nr:uncharacterized protein LOC132583339 [Heteronotia binoei]
MTAGMRMDQEAHFGLASDPGTIDETSAQDFRNLMEVNTVGSFLACKYALPYLRETKGNIINVASIVGVFGTQHSVSYASSKGALISMAKALAIDESKYGVRVNSISPGIIWTPLTKKLTELLPNTETVQQYKDSQLMRRLGTPEEVALTVLFLAADATFSTGLNLLVTGGAEVGFGKKNQVDPKPDPSAGGNSQGSSSKSWKRDKCFRGSCRLLGAQGTLTSRGDAAEPGSDPRPNTHTPGGRGRRADPGRRTGGPSGRRAGRALGGPSGGTPCGAAGRPSSRTPGWAPGRSSSRPPGWTTRGTAGRPSGGTPGPTTRWAGGSGSSGSCRPGRRRRGGHRELKITFDGDGEAVEYFTIQCNMFFTHWGAGYPTEASRVDHIASRLRGPAQKWYVGLYTGRKPELATVADFLQAMLRQYGDPLREEKAIAALQRIEQVAGGVTTRSGKKTGAPELPQKERFASEADLEGAECPDGLEQGEGGLWLHKGKIYVPKSMRKEVLEQSHSNRLAGHFGPVISEDVKELQKLAYESLQDVICTCFLMKEKPKQVVEKQRQTADMATCLRYPGKVVIVTGGTSGIGLAIVREFVHQGANVVFCSRARGAEEGQAIQSELQASGCPGDAFYQVCDVRNESDIKRLILVTVERYGCLDCLVNNAGDGDFKGIDETSVQDFRNIMEVNVVSCLLASKYALPYLRQTKGNIINMASIVGVFGGKGNVSYIASKGAVIALTKALAIDESKYGVRVNSISPSYIQTPLFEKDMNLSPNPEAATQKAINSQLMGRLGAPEEVALAALFLATDATFCTGLNLMITGGAEVGFGEKNQMKPDPTESGKPQGFSSKQ